MREQFLKNISVLRKAIADKKLVVFAGAGISMDSGVPSWGQLIKELKQEVSIPASENDPLRIAQMYFNERQQKEFVEKIRTELKHRKLRYSVIHEWVFEIRPEHVITTNFDDLLEQVIKSKAHPFSVIRKDSEFPYANNTKFLVKMHGDLDEANLVLKEDDYLEYSKQHPLIESFIKGVFANRIVLFVGYSFSDIDLKMILQSIRNILGDHFQNAYLLNTEDDFHPSQRQYLKSKGINVINYHDPGLVDGGNYIEQYLFQGDNATKLTEIETKLSKKGLRLVNMLKFIHYYDDFKQRLETENVVNQLYKSLERFEEARVLPQKFVANLYPFNNSRRFIHNYYDTTISSNNDQLTVFFFNDLEKESPDLKESFFDINNIEDAEKRKIKEKFKKVLQRLNYSLIFYFGRNKDRLHTYDYPKNVDEQVAISLSPSACQCLSCLFHNMQLKDFLRKIKTSSITETSEIGNDLLIAYSNYMAANFRIAYDQFEEIANKAWQLGKYISYYISKRNIKYLRNLLSWESDAHTETDRDDTVRKIDDLDLDKLLFQIPTLGDPEYRFLKIIRDDEVLTDAEAKISEYHDKISGVAELYQRRGFSSGPDYTYLLRLELHKVFNFYNYNFLIEDGFDPFKRVFRKGISALLISYSISDDYPQRLKNIDVWVARFIILYGDNEALKKVLTDYKIKGLHVNEEEQPEVFELLNNILESSFTENNVFRSSILPDDNLSVQTKNFYFLSKLRSMLQNAFYLYGGIKIPADHATVIIKNFLGFFTTDERLLQGSGEYVTTFLRNLIQHFTEPDFDKLLEIISEKEAYCQWEELFMVVADGMAEKYPEKKIMDEAVIKSIIAKCTKRRTRRSIGFMYLWPVCSALNQVIIRDEVRAELSAHFYTLDYLNACYNKIIEPGEYYERYINELEQWIPADLKWEKDEPSHDGFTFSNFIYMLYSEDVLDDDIPFNKFDQYPAFWKFYFKPDSFDYTQFDARWLLITGAAPVHARLSKIPEVREGIRKALKEEFNKALSELYVKYYLN